MGKKVKSIAKSVNIARSPLGVFGNLAPKNVKDSMNAPLDAAGNVMGVWGPDGSVIPYDDFAYSKGANILSPQFESYRDKDGNLKDMYKYDPTKSEAFSQLRTQALSTAPSTWANMQTQKQKMEQQDLTDQANKQSLQAMNQANSMLARTGGLSSGAAGLAARANSRNMMLQNQQIARGGMSDRLGISQADEDRRQQLLGQVADTETAGQQYNLGNLMGDVNRKSEFDLSRYKEQMATLGADKTAAAQQAAAAQTRKGKK